MRSRTRIHLASLLAALALAAFVVSDPSAAGRRFFNDDPLQKEPETQDASKVAEWDVDLLVDLTVDLFGRPGDKTPNVRARNINTIDEVPDSSWFTNRILAASLTLEEMTRGPLRGDGPTPGRWTVVAPKKAGAAPGFTMRDSTGELWFVSFDSDGFPEAATAAILVANKIFWALGYWQVENHLVTVRRDQLDIAGSAKFTPVSGLTRPMAGHDLDAVFERAHRSPDGTYRAIAARGLPGRPVGPFKYFGTRPDDPNDIVPHEHRRELRALRVFGAWTNLVDMKAGNTLDTVVTENGRSVVRHYLQDVGSTFGTGANGPHDWEEGYEYIVEPNTAVKRLFTFNLPMQPWETVKYEPNKAIGRFEGTEFDPLVWKPRAPTAAYLRARPDDNFWAARRVAAFTDDQIRAIARTGQYSEPSDEALLAKVLIQRRDKIKHVYLNAINPLVDFALSADGRLTFKNAAVDAGVAKAPAQGYRATWASFDNDTDTATPIGSPTSATATEASAPAGLPSAAGAYVKVSVSAQGAEHEEWAQPVDVYFQRTASGWRLVGLDRLPATK